MVADASAQLMSAILDLAGDLDSRSLLERFVALSVQLTGARYGAINIVDSAGASTTFVHTGIDARTAAALGRPPHAAGVLGQIPDDGVLRLDDLRDHSAFRGLPAGHPPMGSFLGAPVRVRGERYGTLYLAEKHGGFDAEDESVVRSLAAAAAVAVHNAQLYALERRQRQWQSAGRAITTMLLEGADQEDVLAAVAANARQIDGAQCVALALPGADFELLLEIVDGVGTDDLVGLDVSGDLDVRAAFEAGAGHVVGSRADRTGAAGRAPAPLDRYGPALYAPLLAEGESIGVLVMLRAPGEAEFTADDLTMSQSFASQAALAFVLAEGQQLRGQAVLRDERTRIARDLHDMAIQQLFAAGMAIEAARQGNDPVPPALDGVLETAVGHVDAGIRQIRVIVRTLDDPGATVPLVDRVAAEVELARSSLGFAPALSMSVDGVGVETDPALGLRIDDLVAPGRANNVVAVVREGLSNVARHARSGAVAVRLLVTSGAHGSITVEVEDDGVGVPPARTRASGTKNLARRAEESGGTFALLQPPSGRGALLRWTAALD